MTKQETVAQLCFDAAAYIEERGLAKKELATPDGRLCVRGALNMADHGTPFCAAGVRGWVSGYVSAEVLRADAHLAERLGGSPAGWNNQPERTQQEVCDELRAAGRDLLADSSDPVPLAEGVPVPA